MALEIGLQALKALYQLAKMIKEAKDNVIMVNAKLKNTHSVEEVIELQISSIGAHIPEDILQNAKTRLVGLRRISRRMKMKYQPLISILDQLGGAAATIKSMSTRLSKGVLSAAMALGCLSVMMRRHGDREEARAVQVLRQKIAAESSDAELPQDFIQSVLADPASVTTDDLLLAAPFPVSPAATDAFLVFRSKCETLATTLSFLDQLDALVAELKVQDAVLKDELDKEDGESDEHDKGYSLLPSYSGKKKKTKAAVEAVAISEPTSRETRERGAGLVLDALLCNSDNNHLVDESLLAKVMGEGYAPERLSFLRRQLGTYQDESNKRGLAITRERFRQFMLEEGAHNAGFNIALLGSAALHAALAVDFSEAPALMERTRSVMTRVVRPLIANALSFGLLFQAEGMREGVADDPEEIAALQAEADERSLESRMVLMEAFAVDYEESYDYNLAPDPSLLLSVAIDAGESKYGLGPSTRRRLELLLAILSICNIDADKAAIERVEHDLKQELALLSSLGSSSISEKIAELHTDLVRSAFDARKMLAGEAADFWVKSFGLSCYEVSWPRFRTAFSENFASTQPTPISERDVKRMQFLLSTPPSGFVTLDSFRSFTGGVNGGSLSRVVQTVSAGSVAKVMKTLSSMKMLPADIDALVTPSVAAAIEGSGSGSGSRLGSASASGSLGSPSVRSGSPGPSSPKPGSVPLAGVRGSPSPPKRQQHK